MKKYLPPLYLLISLFILTIAYSYVSHYSVENFAEVTVLKVEGSSIVIGNGCKAIIADTSPERAYAIQMGLENTIESRPLTPDTFAQALKSFNVTLEAVKMTRYDGKYYYSDMILSNDKKVLTLDTMPSDAIALALRMDAKIYVNKTLLGEVGEDIC